MIAAGPPDAELDAAAEAIHHAGDEGKKVAPSQQGPTSQATDAEDHHSSLIPGGQPAVLSSYDKPHRRARKDAENVKHRSTRATRPIDIVALASTNIAIKSTL